MAAVTSINWNHHRNIPGPDSCRHALFDAIDRVEREGHNKVLIILLKDTEGQYDAGWSQAGMRLSECLSLVSRMAYAMNEEMDR